MMIMTMMTVTLSRVWLQEHVVRLQLQPSSCLPGIILLPTVSYYTLLLLQQLPSRQPVQQPVQLLVSLLPLHLLPLPLTDLPPPVSGLGLLLLLLLLREPDSVGVGAQFPGVAR